MMYFRFLVFTLMVQFHCASLASGEPIKLNREAELLAMIGNSFPQKSRAWFLFRAFAFSAQASPELVREYIEIWYPHYRDELHRLNDDAQPALPSYIKSRTELAAMRAMVSASSNLKRITDNKLVEAIESAFYVALGTEYTDNRSDYYNIARLFKTARCAESICFAGSLDALALNKDDDLS